MVPLPPNPKPFVLYGFGAFLLTLFTLREAFGIEPSFSGTVIFGGVSIFFWSIAIVKLVKGEEVKSDIEGLDSLNRAVSRLMMRIWLVFAVIGTTLALIALYDSDWILGVICTLLAAFCWYYAYANWQNSRESSTSNSSAS